MRIEASDDFTTIHWPDPGMAAESWIGDRMHFPGPVVHLGQHLARMGHEHAFNSRTIFVNGHQFSLTPAFPKPPREVVERGLTIWHEEYSPRLRRFCQRVRTTDFDALTLPETANAFDALAAEGADGFRTTQLVTSSFMAPTFAMVRFLEERLGPDGPVLAGSLLQGHANVSAAAGAAMDRLATMAAAAPTLAATVRSGNRAAIAAAPGGEAFLNQFDQFLDEFGWRAQNWGELHRPTWAQAPEIPLDLIARYIEAPASGLVGIAGRASDGRTAALAEVEARLEDKDRGVFRRMVEATRDHVAISEDRARWQLSLVGIMRLPALALGRKLVEAGALHHPDDVFFLLWEDAKRAASAPGPWAADLADKGREEYAHWERLAPPPFVGAPLDLSAVPPELLTVARYFVGMGEARIDGSTVTGIGASPGTHTGRARVIKHLDEADRLEPGDVLVCVTTSPPWTALFTIAGAVVTDTGGVMSHSAICAPEFAIPCVVGTQVGTQFIRDAATITVDGHAGTVTVES